MGSPFAAAAAAAAQRAPFVQAGAVTPGRVLLLDGDGAAYYCAGGADASPQDAKVRLRQFVESRVRAVGAESVRVLLTGSGSHKGHRYAIARVKPYQGQRTNSHRPPQWQFLRDLLEGGGSWPCEVVYHCEADDLFGKYASDPNVVIGTQDKDMRMLSNCWHMRWEDGALAYIGDEFCTEHWGKTFGEYFFWWQMLRGDPVDFIPGLPRIKNAKGTAMVQCGEVGAANALAGVTSTETAFVEVSARYTDLYGEWWATNMLEQACLLWMRRDPGSLWNDVVQEGKPLAALLDCQSGVMAYKEIENRVKEADALQAQVQ